mmetsp:Transcript_38309/g.59808  ORF Transcript_38309/g.59808 Transcript_38309/m.59808 type:complete len:197 (+) Transcript_38309:54-644(+)
MQRNGSSDFLRSEDMDELSERETDLSDRRMAGSRRDILPEFGPKQLVEELDSAEKIVKEVDRQLRGGAKLQVVKRHNGPNGSVSHETGAAVLSQAAVGEDILGYTDYVSERQSIRNGNTRTLSRPTDCTPLASTHTLLVNTAVVERPVLPYSEKGRKDTRGGGADDQFEVQESTIVPNRSGMSILMFDLSVPQPVN